MVKQCMSVCVSESLCVIVGVEHGLCVCRCMCERLRT